MTSHLSPPTSPQSVFTLPGISNMLCQNEEDDMNTMPDFNEILLKFGINCNKLNVVPLENYHWWIFEADNPTGGLTISQRIKTMSRKARKSCNISQT